MGDLSKVVASTLARQKIHKKSRTKDLTKSPESSVLFKQSKLTHRHEGSLEEVVGE
jgi:hypothetical protein